MGYLQEETQEESCVQFQVLIIPLILYMHHIRGIISLMNKLIKAQHPEMSTF